MCFSTWFCALLHVLMMRAWMPGGALLPMAQGGMSADE